MTGTTSTCGPTGCTSTSASKRNGCVAWSSSGSVPMAPRSWSPSPTATGSRPSPGPTCSATSNAGACAPRCSRSVTAHSGSGAALRDVFPETTDPAVLGAQGRQRPRRAPEVRPADGAADAGRDPRRRGPRPRRGGRSTRSPPSSASKWPKAVAKIVDDAEPLLAFYDFPAEHWIHLKTTNPIESTFATVRLRTKVTKGPGSRAAGLAMAFKLIEAAEHRWRAVNGTAPRRPRPSRRHASTRG